MLETELNNIVESELKARVSNMKLFENLSSEKPTGIFLSLARKRVSGANLNKIKKDDDTDFPDEKSRDEYITKFFEDLYKKDPEEPENFDNVMENFLGLEILESNVVKNSKITPDLDGPNNGTLLNGSFNSGYHDGALASGVSNIMRQLPSGSSYTLMLNKDNSVDWQGTLYPQIDKILNAAGF